MLAFRVTRGQIAVGAVLVAEIAVLCLVAFASGVKPADGLVVRPGTASIEFADQTSAWNTVTAKSVVTPGASWLVVQSVRPDGTPSKVYGYQRVPAGRSEIVVVKLDNATSMSNTLILTLVADRGQPNVFEYTPPAAARTGGGMGGGMGGAAPSANSAAPGASAGADKPLIADGQPVAVIVREVYHDAAGLVDRRVVPR